MCDVHIVPLKIPCNARVTPFSLALFAARLRYGHQALVGMCLRVS